MKKLSSGKWDSPLPIPDLKPHVALLCISAAAFISYAKSLSASFVFDDHEAIINNKDVTSANSSIRDLFFHDFWGTPVTHHASHKSYRPLTILCFRLLYQLSGGELKAFVYHLVNITLHVIVSCLTFFAYNIIFEMRCPKSVFFCSLLFAVHPVHTETVAGIVGQAELLSAFFALLSFIVFHYGCVCKRSLISTVIYSLSCCALSIVAMLCKEQGITIIGINIVYDIVVVNKLTIRKLHELISSFLRILVYQNLYTLPKMVNYCNSPCKFSENTNGLNKTNGKSVCNGRSTCATSIELNLFIAVVLRNMILVVTTMAALYVRWLVMGSTLPIFQDTDNPASFEDNFYSRVLNYNYIYLLDVWILLFPEWLCFDWSMGCVPLIKFTESVFDIRIVLVFTFWFILIALIYSIYRSSSNTQRMLVIGVSSMFIMFLPASNIFFKVGFVVAERVLYLPSFGYFIVIVVGLQRLASYEKHRKLLQLFVAILVMFFSLRSIQRTEDWLNERMLFESALDVCPLNAKVHYNLAKNSADRGYKKFAISHYEEAIRLNRKYDIAMNNLANIYRDEGNLEKAEKLLIQALKIRPDFSSAWMNLGIVYSSIGMFNESEMCYLEALKYRKRYPDCFYNLGNLYLEVDRKADAIAAWKNATSLKPTHRTAWSNLILMLDSMGRLEEALNESYNALSYLPYEPNIHFHLANSLGKLNKYEESEKHFLYAIKVNPSIARYHYNLGVLYHRWKKFCEARYHYTEADRLNSTSKAQKQINLLKKSGKIDSCELKS